MLVCPKCHCEYREGYTKCRDCNVELVFKDNDNDSISNIKWVFLYNFREEFKAIEAKTILEDYNIPVLVKSRGSGEYLKLMQGISYYGFDLYVQDHRSEEAKKILEDFIKAIEEVLPLDREDIIEAKKHERKKRFRIRLLLLILWGPLLIVFLAKIIKYI